MTKYVNAEKMPSGDSWDALNDKEKAAVLSFLIKLPTADVQEVKHAKWIKDERQKRDDGEIYDYCCSLCRGAATEGDYGNYDVLTDFCPHCGAKMDGWEINE